MTDLHVTLLSDGPSDRVLLRPISWLLGQHLSGEIAVQLQWADFRPLAKRPENLAQRIVRALELYPADLLFVHRDAERESPDVRYAEIEQARAESRVAVPIVSVVPVRMTEAWLLFDVPAIRRAAGNPNGTDSLRIPVRDAESVADPKGLLKESIRIASGLSGRRFGRFNLSSAVYRAVEYIDDFTPLRTLPSFRKLEADLANAVRDHGWG
jgi:hypothetical protein